MRALTATMKVGIPGPEGSIAKWEWAIAQPGADRARRATSLGPEALDPRRPQWAYRFLRSRANSIEGGTTDVLKNIVAERVLGLPRLR